MKQKLLLSAALVAATLFNFTSCKEDDDEIKWNYEKINLKNIYAKHDDTTINLEEFQDFTFEDSTTITIKVGSTGVPGQKIRFDMEYGVVGESLNHVESVGSVELHVDKPFEEYILNIVFWGEDEDGNMSQKSDAKEVHFYYIPKLDFVLSRDFGEGEYSTTIKWNLGRYTYGERIKTVHGAEITNNEEEEYFVIEHPDYIYTIYDANKYSLIAREYEAGYGIHEKTFQEPSSTELQQIKKKLSQMKVVVEVSSDEVQSNINPIETSFESGSIKLKQHENGIEYAIKPISGIINGKEQTLYEEAYKYNIKVTLKMLIGDKTAEWTASKKSILIDKDAYAIDRELNVYRTAKFGDYVWTIDNYRGTKDPSLAYVTSDNSDYANAGFYFYKKWIHTDDHVSYVSSTHMINGYHMPSIEEWEALESYLGIDMSETKDIEGTYKPFCFNGEDISEYETYWGKNIPWYVFDSEDEIVGEANYPSFNTFFAGMAYLIGDDWKWTNDFATFACDENSYKVIVVSKKHKSISHAYNYFVNIRLVKDRE